MYMYRHTHTHVHCTCILYTYRMYIVAWYMYIHVYIICMYIMYRYFIFACSVHVHTKNYSYFWSHLNFWFPISLFIIMASNIGPSLMINSIILWIKHSTSLSEGRTTFTIELYRFWGWMEKRKVFNSEKIKFTDHFLASNVHVTKLNKHTVNSTYMVFIGRVFG